MSNFSRHKKSHKLLGLLEKEFPQQPNNQFIRSYSQLLSKHFSQSHKQKSSLRKSFSSSNAFNAKKQIKSFNKHTNLQQQTEQSFIHFVPQQQNLEASSLQNSINPETMGSNVSKQRFIESNTETNLKLQKIIMSKTQLLQRNSHENVILNQKLHQSSNQKRALMSMMQNLRMEILKEKKIKAKISTNMGKLMNRIEEVNAGIKKTEEQRFFVKKQTKLLEKALHIETRKNQQFNLISAMNNEKISIEKELINTLYKTLQRSKMEYLETKTHLNEIKQIYMRETKCLVKVEMHKHQSEQEMNFLCKTVQQSVTNTKEAPKP